MDTNTFMGILISCIAVLGGIISVTVAIVVKPVINLNRSLVELNTNIKELNSKNAVLESKVEKHDDAINDSKIKLEKHELVLQTQGKEIQDLKHRVS